MTQIKFTSLERRNKVLNEIYDSLLDMGIDEIKRYANEFPHAKDYNIVEYGNLLIYYDDIRNLYNYRVIYSNDTLWDKYKKDVGYVAWYILKHIGKKEGK